MATAAPAPPVDGPTWASAWSPARLESQRHALYLARLERLRGVMRQTGMPALLVMDANHIFYATGARNMQIFALRSPSRYLLVFESGPCILYEYAGCAHLAADLPTGTHIRQALSTGFARLAGRLARENAPLPLYWLLITKGYRTWRYLPLFAHEYWPNPGCATPPASLPTASIF